MKFLELHRVVVFLFQVTLIWSFPSDPAYFVGDITSSYYVSIQNKTSNSHLCNGAIHQFNGDTWIITSATCTINLMPSDIVVFYGSKSLNDVGFRSRVKSINTHPRFDVDRHWYDIGLLLLDENIPNIQGVSFPTKDIAIHQPYTHGGWKIGNSRNESDSLQINVEVPISKEECKQSNPALRSIRGWMICTNRFNKPTDCSYQKLGSILTSSDGTLHGILSSCNANTPIYTNAYKLVDWMQFNVERH